jgi:hypothetical protein
MAHDSALYDRFEPVQTSNEKLPLLDLALAI